MSNEPVRIEDYREHLARLGLVIVTPKYEGAVIAGRPDVFVTHERMQAWKNPYIRPISLAPASRAQMVKRIEKAAAGLEPPAKALPAAGHARALKRGR